MQASRRIMQHPSSNSEEDAAMTGTSRAPSDTIRRPMSLLSSSLPSFGNSNSANGLSSADVTQRPRRLWKVNDTSLRSIPKFYPKLNPRTTVFVSDASPSVVAVRISECLRKRSVAVEYDEEAVTATAITSDRCQFTVHLYKGNAQPIDFSYGVVVECNRVAGSPITFHRTARAVLAAAQGMSTGEDQRKSHFTSVTELRRRQLIPLAPAPSVAASARRQLPPSTDATIGTQQALERARELLKKDRFECQQLGMESLVALTTVTTSGIEVATHASTTILQQPWICPYIVSTDDTTDTQSGTASKVIGAYVSAFLDTNPPDCAAAAVPTTRVSEEQAKQDGVLRAGALRVLSNALQHIDTHQPKTLHRLLQTRNVQLASTPFLQALVLDLKGANRPVSIAATTRLASAHEAALAVSCLRILAKHSGQVHDYLQSESVLEQLESARSCGRSTHLILQHEAEATYTQVTEDARSC